MELGTMEANRFEGVLHKEDLPDGKESYGLEVQMDGQPCFIAGERDLGDMRRALWGYGELMQARAELRTKLADVPEKVWPPPEQMPYYEVGRFALRPREFHHDRGTGAVSWNAELCLDRKHVAVLCEQDAADLGTLADEADRLVKDYLREGRSVETFALERGHTLREALAESPEEAQEVHQSQGARRGQKL